MRLTSFGKFLASWHRCGQALAQRSLPASEEGSERLGQMHIPGHESVVAIPGHKVQFFLEVKKVDEDPDV